MENTIKHAIEDFVANLTPMKAGRIKKSLARPIKISGEYFSSKAKAVAFLVAKGYKPSFEKAARLYSPDGSFFELGVFPAQYAEFLLNRTIKTTAEKNTDEENANE